MKHASPDYAERLKDFFARHGGSSSREPCEGEHAGGLAGWSEVYANDGYALRCDWSTLGTRQEMKYSEISAADWRTPREGGP